MKNYKNYFAIVLSILFIASFAGSAVGQNAKSKEDDKNTPPTAAASTQTVNAKQSGDWTVGVDPARNVVGIDPTRNAVSLANTAADPVPVKVIENGSGRKAFQARIFLTPQGIGFTTANLAIPPGKRLIIENISAVGRCPEGLKMEINFFSFLDNGDGVGDSITDITFHRIALTDQGVFDGVAISAANHKVLVFADEQIGTSHFYVGVQARLNGVTTAFAQAQVTFSGYLEDLPTTP